MYYYAPVRRVLLLVILSLLPVSARAFPAQSIRLLDHAFVGPADADLSAIHYNPAALRLLSGFHLTLSATAAGSLGAYRRSVDVPAGFSPGGAGASCPTDPACTASIAWPSPGWFIAASWDLGSESVTLGAAFYNPYTDATSYGGAATSPTRYHANYERTDNLMGDIGAALRLASWLNLGAGFHFAWTHTQLGLTLDPGVAGLPCVAAAGAPCEQWLNRQVLDLDVSGWSYGFSTGVLMTLIDNRLWLGASFFSTQYSSSGAQLDLDGRPGGASQCRQEDGPHPGRGVWLSSATEAGRCGAARLSQATPHLIYLGARLRTGGWAGRLAPEHLEFVATTRVGVPPRTDREILLERQVFAGVIPDKIVIPMQDRPSFLLSLEARQRFRRLSLGQALSYQSPYSSAALVSPANLDGHRVDGTLTVILQLSKKISLGVGAGVTGVIFAGDAGAGFDPGLAAACQRSGYDVTTVACQAVQAGWAVPTAAGTPWLVVVHGSAGLSVAL